VKKFGGRMKTRTFITILVLSVLIMGCINNNKEETTTTTISEITARYGDIVSVSYIGKFENGTIFDTSYADVARDAGIYNPMREYKPLTFRIGEGKIISGFEAGIIGMHIGEEKNITVPPELGYGNWNPKKVIDINRLQKGLRVINVSIDEFRRNVGEDPIINKTYIAPSSGWNITVLSIMNDTVEILQTPKEGSIISTPYGPGVINVTDTEILVRINPKIGDKIRTEQGVAKVIYVSDKVVRLDFNHELVSKTLYFVIKLENITKGDNS